MDHGIAATIDDLYPDTLFGGASYCACARGWQCSDVYRVLALRSLYTNFLRVRTRNGESWAKKVNY